MSLDGLSLSRVVAELSPLLVGGRIEKIFQPDNNSIILFVRQPGETLRLLINIAANYPRLQTISTSPPNPLQAPTFCMLLRKHLEDGRIAAVRQHGEDRVVSIDFDVLGERGIITTKQLTVELMGKYSNIIFIHNDTIIDAIRRVSLSMSRHRQILPLMPYLPPPPQTRLSLLTADAADIAERTLSGKTSLAKSLIQTADGMGPITAREILWRAGLPADITAEQMAPSDIASIREAIAEIAEALRTGAEQATVIIGANGGLAAIAAFTLNHLAPLKAIFFDTVNEAIAYSAVMEAPIKNQPAQELIKTVQTELARLDRKAAALNAELLEANDAEQFRHRADILMIYLYQVPSNAHEVILPDILSADENAQITIKLNPALTPIGNAQALYARYNKLQRRLVATAAQLEDCRAETDYLHTVAHALETATLPDNINEIKRELISGGYIKEKSKARKTASVPTVAPLQTSIDGMSLLIGRNNYQNDRLTFKTAQPNDLWFHVKDIPGSHVILRTGNTKTSADTIALAANYAAWYSKARNSANVPVDYTLCRYVKKPSGAKPGYVIYDKQQTVYVTPNEELIDTK